MSADFKINVKTVLDFYQVPFKEDENGNILIPKHVWDDTDTMWNYTTKANDVDWLQQRR